MSVDAVMKDKIGIVGINAITRMFIYKHPHIPQREFHPERKVPANILKSAVIISDQPIFIKDEIICCQRTHLCGVVLIDPFEIVRQGLLEKSLIIAASHGMAGCQEQGRRQIKSGSRRWKKWHRGMVLIEVNYAIHGKTDVLNCSKLYLLASG